MKKSGMSGSSLLHVILCVLFFSMAGCEPTEDVQPDLLKADLENDAKKSKTSIYYGPATAVGDGTARVWVQTVQGKPVALGVEMSEGALEGLPMHDIFEVYLKMPGQAHATGIKEISLGWNPMGHEPSGVYSVPHFDFHFYMITMGQIMKIHGGLDEGAYEIMERGILPPYYVFGPAPFAVPHMGVHWSDVNSPEFSPAGFSRTFIYGSHEESIIFFEPMVTLSYLMNMEPGTQEVINVPALNIVEDPGYYPGTYTISHSSSGSYSVALTDMHFRKRSH